MSEPRQPVKGKPHIRPVCSFPEPGHMYPDFELIGEAWGERYEASRWAERVCPAWFAWWRQHQEAA